MEGIALGISALFFMQGEILFGILFFTRFLWEVGKREFNLKGGKNDRSIS